MISGYKWVKRTTASVPFVIYMPYDVFCVCDEAELLLDLNALFQHLNELVEWFILTASFVTYTNIQYI